MLVLFKNFRCIDLSHTVYCSEVHDSPPWISNLFGTSQLVYLYLKRITYISMTLKQRRETFYFVGTGIYWNAFSNATYI